MNHQYLTVLKLTVFAVVTTVTTIPKDVENVSFVSKAEEFVYMSGYIYQSVYEAAAANVMSQIERRRLTEARTPEVEKAKKAALDEMEERVSKYNTFAMRLRDTLAEYARQKLPANPQYVEVLHALVK